MSFCSKATLRNYVAEFLGTLFLVCTIKAGGQPWWILMVLVYTYGYISGGLFNPSVTLSIVFGGGTKSFPSDNYANIAIYIFVQLIAGVIGGGFGCWMTIPETGNQNHTCAATYPQEDENFSKFGIFCGEFFFTFLLCTAVLHTGIDQPGNQFYGLAIGWVVFSASFTEGSVSGAALNPAVYIGLVLSSLMFSGYSSSDSVFDNMKKWYLYLIGEILAAVLAGFVYKFFYRPKSSDGYEQQIIDDNENYDAPQQTTADTPNVDENDPGIGGNPPL